jgi:hypothetical protein
MIRLGGGMKVRGSQGWPAADDNTRPGLAALSQGLAGRFAPGRKNVVSGVHREQCLGCRRFESAGLSD